MFLWEIWTFKKLKKIEFEFMDQKKNWFQLYFFTDRQGPEPIEEEGTEEGEMGMVLEWFWPITILVIDFHQSMIHHLNTHLHLVILQQLELGKFFGCIFKRDSLWALLRIWFVVIVLSKFIYRKVASSRPVYYSILDSLDQRSQYISIKFPLHKHSENP